MSRHGSRTRTSIASINASGDGIVGGTGDIHAGSKVTLTVAFTGPVTVDTTSGSPALALNDGGTARYLSGSGTNSLTFSYVPAAGENTADLTIAAFKFNGASILGAGHSVSVGAATNYNPAGVLQIDTTSLLPAPTPIPIPSPVPTPSPVSPPVPPVGSAVTTPLHYAVNGNIVNGVYAPGAAGFNLADVSSVAELDSLPTGVKGLAYLGMTNGADAAFQSAVSAYIGDPKLFGFYLVDEPSPTNVSAANLKAESDWIHTHVPGAKTFIVEQNLGSELNPVFAYNPANTNIDLFGLDPYPVQTNVPNNLDYNTIPIAVDAAIAAGIPKQDIVPVYQAFGGGQYTTYITPTAAQEQQIIATWASIITNPAFDYAYSWGTQVGDTAISNDPALLQVFTAHNAK